MAIMEFLLRAGQHGSRVKSRGVAALIWATTLASGTSGAAPEPAYPPRSLVLIVAPWCAPCYGELAHIEEIAAAVRPRTVRVLLAEDGARARAMTRGIGASYRWEPAADDARRVRAGLLTRAAGLPYSVVTDDDGHVCGEDNLVLDGPRARALVRRC